jgi:hypothetical protein
MNFRLYKSIVFLGVLLGGCSVGNQQGFKPINRAVDRIVGADKNVNSTVVSIMQAMGCEYVPTKVDAFAAEFFPRFARKRGVERWDVHDTIDEKTKAYVLNLFDELGFFCAVQPKQKAYDYVVILGATLGRMRTRLGTLKLLWEQGVRAKRVVFLTGARPLEAFEGPELLADFKQTILPIKEGWLLPSEFPKTEAAGLMALWDQAQLPQDLRGTPLDFIDTPLQVWPDGKLERPNTGDTLLAWLAQKPTPGSCLFITNQPYVGYQEAMVRRFVPKDFTIETVSLSTGKEDKTVGVLVDALVRELAIEACVCGLWDEKTLESYLKQ